MAGTEVEVGPYGGRGGDGNFSSSTPSATSPAPHNDAEVDEEGADGELLSTSQVLLWVPHATIALLLIGLVAASFVRFHSKHGHKYRKPSTPGVAREAPTTAWMQDNAVVDLQMLDGQSPVTDPPVGTTTPISPTNPPLEPLDDEAGAVQIDWWDSGTSAEPPDRISESSGRLQSNGGVCNPVESGGRRGAAGGAVGGEAPRALFSVWTLRRGRVGDIVCLPKAISKPLRVSAGDCTTDECHELLLEKL